MTQMVENNAALGNAWHIQNCVAFDSAALSQSRGPDKCLSMGVTSVVLQFGCNERVLQYGCNECVVLQYGCNERVLQYGCNECVVLQYAILLMVLLHICIKYVLHTIDVQNENSWENKAIYLLYTELLLGE